MSVAIYLRYRQELKTQSFNGRNMPYNWGNMPDPQNTRWRVYYVMFDDFPREIANEINIFNHNIQALTAWSVVVLEMTNQQKMSIVEECIQTLATYAVNTPTIIKSRFVFAIAQLSHQANRSNTSGWIDDLPADEKITFNVADKYAGSWRKYRNLKARLENIAGQKYRKDSCNFRNAYNHQFVPNFIVGATSF